MTTLVTLVRSDRVDAELRAALKDHLDTRRRVSIVQATAWKAVEETLAQRPVAVVVFDLSHPGIAPMPRVTSTIGGHAGTEFVLYVGGLGRVRPQQIVEVARAGVRCSLSPRTSDGEIRLGELLDEAIATGANELLLQELRPLLDPDQLELLCRLMRHAPDAPRVQDLASRLGMSARTLERYACDAGLPRPSRVLSWLHLYHVCRRVAVDGSTLDRAVKGTAFSSAFSFRRALQRVTGRDLSDLRRPGGPAALARIFATSLFEAPVQLRLGLAPPRPGHPPPAAWKVMGKLTQTGTGSSRLSAGLKR